jgi:hypothetical protein
MYTICTTEELRKADKYVRKLDDVLDGPSAMRSLIDKCEELYTEWHNDLPEKKNARGEAGGCYVVVADNPGYLQALLGEGFNYAAHVLRGAFSRPGAGLTNRYHDCPPYVRQFNRLLNLTARVLADGIKDSKNPEVPVAVRIERAEWLITLSETALGRVYPNYDQPAHYYEQVRHPDAQKWLRIHARCKRRLHELWLESARADEDRADNLAPFPHQATK